MTMMSVPAIPARDVDSSTGQDTSEDTGGIDSGGEDAADGETGGDTAVDIDADDTTVDSGGDDTGGVELWSPPPGTTWQWQLQGDIDTSFDVAMYDIDLFDVSDELIAELHGAGRVVICYFSAGSREDWRDDADRFESADYANPLGGWPGEHWLDIRSANVRAIMRDRIAYASERGCDGVEPDNVDGFDNNTGFDYTRADQLDYNRFLASEAHSHDLSIGLKNALDLIEELEPEFDWALNEECLSYDECEMLSPFIEAGKAVFHVEYVDDESDGAAMRDDVCGDPTISGFSTLIKTWDLEAWRLTCAGD